MQSVSLGEKHIGRQFESGAQSSHLGKIEFPPSGEKHRNCALASKFGDQIPLVQALIREKKPDERDRIGSGYLIVFLLIALDK